MSVHLFMPALLALQNTGGRRAEHLRAKMPNLSSFIAEVVLALMTIVLISLTSVEAEVGWANTSHPDISPEELEPHRGRYPQGHPGRGRRAGTDHTAT
jgi:hypothetical protein